MGGFSISDWLIVVVILAFPAIIIALENTSELASRRKYGAALVSAFAVSVLGNYLTPLAADSQGAGVAVGLTILAVWIYFTRVLVQRVRDAGHPKALAYLAVLPIANLVFFAYLLFPSSAARSAAGPG
jgi:uncharacterized membrane protein YhaH (DUF805 family)